MPVTGQKEGVMPREMIQLGHPRSTDNPEFQLWVGWERDRDVQVGIGIPDDTDEAKGLRSPSLIEILYGDEQSLQEIGHWLATFARMADSTDKGSPWMNEDNTEGGWEYDEERMRENATGLLAAISEIKRPYGTTVWWRPSRYAINNLIRALRKARDAAYGKDE